MIFFKNIQVLLAENEHSSLIGRDSVNLMWSGNVVKYNFNDKNYKFKICLFLESIGDSVEKILV